MADDFGNQLAFMNPATAAALRRQAYAQKLMEQGTDVSPLRSGWQAAARAIQGVLGGYEMATSQGQLQDINKQQQAEAAQQQKSIMDLLGGGGTGATTPGPAAPLLPTAPAPAPPDLGAGSGTGAAQGATAAPAADGKLPPAPQLAPIVSPGGAKFSVAAPYADRFQGLVTDLENAGYKIAGDQSGGFNPRFIAGTNIPSQHASGAAIDVNWTSNARGTQGDIPPELARSLAAKHGLTWGGDWSGKTRDPMHFEVASANRAPADGRYQVAAANTGSQTDVAPVPGAPPGAGAQPGAPAATQGAPPGATPPPNFQQARVLFQKALEMETSTNPLVRAMAGSVRQQATTMMSMGAWGNPVQLGNGQYVQRNSLSGEVHYGGEGDKFEHASNGDIINMRTGAVVSKGGDYARTGTSPSGQPIYSMPGHPPVAVGSGPETYVGSDGGIYDKASRTLVQANPGWTPVGPTAGGGTLYRDEKGGMHTVESAARPETQFANTIATINAKVKSGEALTQQEHEGYTAAYNHLYPFTQKWNQDLKAWALVQEKPPTGNVVAPQDLPMPGVKPAPGSVAANTAGLVKPAAAPVVTPPAQNVRTAELTQQSVGKQMEEDFKQANTDLTTASGNRSILGETATIRSLQPNVRTGYGADAQAHMGSMLTALGAKPEDVQAFMGQNPADAEALQKLFLKQSSSAARGLGAREPGSVIMMFAKAYPSLASQPGTIGLISRLIDMDQHYKEDRANAKLDYLNNQRATMKDPTDYGGERGFKQSWDTQNDPKIYVGAALAAAGQPYSVWAGQLSNAQKVQALQLVHRWEDVKEVQNENGKPQSLIRQQ
jgi:hypothetical protein